MVNITQYLRICMLIILLSFNSSLRADTAESADPVGSLLLQVDEAVAGESYTRAIALIEEGKKNFPGDYRLPLRAGELYRERELYHLALGEYKAAEVLEPDSGDVLYQMAETCGYLGKNDVIDDLSWMYFKTYRMNDGINLLEKTLKNHFNRNQAHTLGTLYSGLYDLDQSRYWYTRSIEDALDNGDEFFASVAYYNLSLLDYSFYLYGSAREEAMRSIELRPRAGGYMILGELDFLAWNLDDSIDSYRKAESRDSTPLSLMDMAAFYQRIGYPDEALRFIQQILNNPDESWMYHYGVNRVRFGMDLHQILSDSWKAKAELESFSFRSGLKQRFTSSVKRLVRTLRGMYHDRIYRSLTESYSRELRDEGNTLDAAWNAASASRGYRREALKYLEEARRIEIELTPRAVPWYELEIGRESGDESMLKDALKDFSDEEREPYERTLRELSGYSDRYLRELYFLNPGGLRQYGLSLPVEVKVSGANSRKISRRIRKLLKRSSYRIVSHSSAGSATSVLTAYSDESGKTRLFLSDPEGRTVSESKVENGLSRRELTDSMTKLFDRFYLTRLGGMDQ